MRRVVTLKANEQYSFDIGRNALILIIRNTTANIVFNGDSITPMELSRSDIVDISSFRNRRMFLENTSDSDVTVEFQISDTRISIREQRMSLDSAAVINEIINPVRVSEVLAPVSIKGTVPVSIDGGINIPEVSVTFPESIGVSVGNFPDVQTVVMAKQSVSALPDVVLGGTGEHLIAGKPSRQALMIQANKNNKQALKVAGFIFVEAGGIATIPANNAISIEGASGDMCTVGEVTCG